MTGRCAFKTEDIGGKLREYFQAKKEMGESEMEEKTILQTLIGFVGRVVYTLFLLLCVGLLALFLSMKKDEDGAATFFGRQMRIVLSNSMEKCNATDVEGYTIKDIPVKALIIIQTVPEDTQEAQAWYASLKKGDVLTFRYVYVGQETITHRLTEDPIPTEGGYILQLSGDNKTSNASTLTQTIDTSQTNSPNYVIGKVTATSYALGAVLVTLKSPVGISCMLILPCFLMMTVEICCLCVGASRQKRLELEAIAREQRAEIVRLRKDLESLERKLITQKYGADLWIEYDD